MYLKKVPCDEYVQPCEPGLQGVADRCQICSWEKDLHDISSYDSIGISDVEGNGEQNG